MLSRGFLSLEAIEWSETMLLQNEFPWNITIHRLSSFGQGRVLY